MAGITITADSGTQFTANAAEFNSVCKLDSNNFAVAYRDNNDFNKGKVNVGSRSGTSITVSSANAVIFNNDSTDFITVRSLSATKIVITWRDINSSRAYVVVATISGTTITLGTAILIDSTSSISAVSVAVLDSTNFVATRFSTEAYHYVCSVSGTTITKGAQQTSAESQLAGACLGLDSTHFVAAGKNYSTGFIAVQVGTVNTGAQTITFGTANVVISSVADNPQISAFDSQHFIVGAVKSSGDSRILAVACSIAGSTITAGGVISTSADYTKSEFSICTITASNFILAYYTTTGTQGEVVSGTLTGGTTLAFDAQGAIIFDNNTSSYTGLCALSTTDFILGYKAG